MEWFLAIVWLVGIPIHYAWTRGGYLASVAWPLKALVGAVRMLAGGRR